MLFTTAMTYRPNGKLRPSEQLRADGIAARQSERIASGGTGDPRRDQSKIKGLSRVHRRGDDRSSVHPEAMHHADRILRAIDGRPGFEDADTDVIRVAAEKILANHRLPPRFGTMVPRGVGAYDKLMSGKQRRKYTTTPYTREIVSRIFMMMSEGLSHIAACGMCGISVHAMQRWMESHPAVSDLMELGRGIRVARLERELLGTTNPTIASSRTKALANANPADWGDTARVEINSTHTFIAAIQEAQRIGIASLEKPLGATAADHSALVVEGAAVDLTSEVEQVFGQS